MRSLLLSACIALAPSLGVAQEYVPTGEVRPGTELVVVFISSSTCVANGDAAFLEAVPRMMASAGASARARSMNPVMIGVAMDNDTRAGVDYLTSFGSFDEVSVGRDWGNALVIDRVWGDPDGPPAIPQVVVMTRTVRSGAGGRIVFEKERVIERFVGPDAIRAWVDGGTPLPAE